MTTFAPDVVAAVLRHMNDDHAADNLTIVRAFVDPLAEQVVMMYLNDTASTWAYSTDPVVEPGVGEPDSGGPGEPVRWQEGIVAWSSRLSERAEIRREVVELHQRAVDRLGASDSA